MIGLILASTGVRRNGVLLIDNKFDKDVEDPLIVLADMENYSIHIGVTTPIVPHNIGDKESVSEN